MLKKERSADVDPCAEKLICAISVVSHRHISLYLLCLALASYPRL